MGAVTLTLNKTRYFMGDEDTIQPSELREEIPDINLPFQRGISSIIFSSKLATWIPNIDYYYVKVFI